MNEKQCKRVIQFVQNNIICKELDVFHLTKSEPWIKSKPGSSFNPIDAQLFSKESASWLVYVIFKSCNILLSPGDVSRICYFIAGSTANKQGLGSDFSRSRLVDDPIVATILAWADQIAGFPFRCSFNEWFIQLGRFKKASSFPGSSSALSRKIKPLLRPLKMLGFDVNLKRTKEGMNVVVSKANDDSITLPSSELVCANALNMPTRKGSDDDACIITTLTQNIQDNLKDEPRN